MFELNYRIVNSEYDDFSGENGFLSIKCNDCSYGEIYSEELEVIMDKVSLYDWFERLLQVLRFMITKKYIALSDVESYNTWIVFRRRDQEVVISNVRAEKWQGSRAIEFDLKEPVVEIWSNQTVNYSQFVGEVIKKTNEYIEYIIINNVENAQINKLRKSFAEVINMMDVYNK